MFPLKNDKNGAIKWIPNCTQDKLMLFLKLKPTPFWKQAARKKVIQTRRFFYVMVNTLFMGSERTIQVWKKCLLCRLFDQNKKGLTEKAVSFPITRIATNNNDWPIFFFCRSSFAQVAHPCSTVEPSSGDVLISNHCSQIYIYTANLMFQAIWNSIFYSICINTNKSVLNWTHVK